MRSSISRLAYCTFLDGDNEYVLGVLALARSLRVCACTFKLIVCTTPNITEAAAALIAAEPNVELRAVEWLELPPQLIAAADVMANPQFVRNFTKLRLWQLTDLTKVCYVDADTLVLQNIDDIFLAPAFSAALDNMSADERFTPERFQVPSFSLRTPLDEPARSYFNAGVMVLEPSASEFDALVAKLATWQPTRFAEQDLLNAYYVGRWNALPLSYNWGKPSFWLCPELCVFAALKVVHFSGRLKPWMRHYDGSWRVDQVALASPQERAAACGNGGPSDANLTRAVDCWWRAFQTVASAEHARSLCVARAKPALSRIPFVAETVAPKVLYVVHRFHPYPGGSENYVHWLATESADRGWHVTVLAGTNKGDQGAIRVTADVGILASERFDAVIVHGSGCSTQDECLALLAAGRVISPVALLVIQPSDAPAALAGLKHASLIGCSTRGDWAHARAHAVDEARLAQVTHGVDGVGSVGAPGFRKRHGISRTGRLFVSAGGFAPHKRMLELTRVFATVAKPQDTLVLFGYIAHPDGDAYVEQCRAVAGVTVLFDRPRQEVLDALLEADLYVMHSAHEGFGLVLLEAMLNGCAWASHAAAGAALDLCRFGELYANDAQLGALIDGALPLQPMRRATLRQAVLARYTVRTSVDDVHRAFSRLNRDGPFGPPPPRAQPVDDPPLVPAAEAARRRACYATFLHGDAGYFLGVLALKKSLDAAGCELPFFVALTSSVPSAHRALLRAAGCELRPVPMLSIGRAATYGALRKEFVACFTKLEIWRWLDFDVVVFLDCDMVATRSLDHLAALRLPVGDEPVPIAAARDLGDASRRTGFSRVVPGRPYFNAGCMVLRPSLASYESLMRVVDKVPTLSLPYAEQDVLNDFAAVHLVELPISYNCHTDKLDEPTYEAEVDAACGIGAQPAIYHFCGPKPWRTLPLHANPRGAAFKARSAHALETWWVHGKDEVLAIAGE